MCIRDRIEVVQESAKRAAVSPQPRRLGRDLRWKTVEPDQLGVRVRSARACGDALVDHCQEMVEALRPGALGCLGPGRGDQDELLIGEVGQRASVSRRVHDDLLPLEGGVEVGYLYPAFERQQVVVHTPTHTRSLADLSDEQLVLIAASWAEAAERAWAQGFDHLLAVINDC